jgi:NitT/TauT family transport system substrate-binding protein
MSGHRGNSFFCALAFGAALLPMAGRASEIDITNYAIAMNGMPFVVALKKGFLKEDGLDVSGIISDTGGGTTVRNVTAGNLLFGETALPAAVLAIQSGADIKIVSGDADLVTDLCFIVKKGSPLTSIKDLKGKRIGFTNPGSTTQALVLLMLEKAGLKPDEVTTRATGGFGAGLTALDNDGVDVMAMTDPLTSKYSDKYTVLAWNKDLFPPMSNVVGIATSTAMKEHPDQIRAVIKARAKAVAYMKDHPDESAEIIAEAYKMEVPVIKQAIKDTWVTVDGVSYWGQGNLQYKGMDNMIHAQQLIGAIPPGTVDWTKYVDESFLSPDLQSKKP